MCRLYGSKRTNQQEGTLFITQIHLLLIWNKPQEKKRKKKESNTDRKISCKRERKQARKTNIRGKKKEKSQHHFCSSIAQSLTLAQWESSCNMSFAPISSPPAFPLNPPPPPPLPLFQHPPLIPSQSSTTTSCHSPRWSIETELFLHFDQACLQFVTLHQHLPQLLKSEARSVRILQVNDHFPFQLKTCDYKSTFTYNMIEYT